METKRRTPSDLLDALVDRGVTGVMETKDGFEILVRDEATERSVTEAMRSDRALDAVRAANPSTRVIGELEALAFTPVDGFSPDLRGGVSIGSRHGASGTLGFVARRPLTRDVGPDYLLTSEHVLRYLDEAAGPDACVVQPGATSTSSAAATAGWVVAKLAGFGNIQLQPFPNTMDAAVAAVIGGARPASWRQVHGVNLVGQKLLANLTIGMQVTKYGAASGTTSGTIVSLNGDAIWKYGRGRTARFAPMIVADLKACPGDSGAPVVFTDATGAYAVGIVSAAAVFNGNYRTFITPLDPITNTLGYVVA